MPYDLSGSAIRDGRLNDGAFERHADAPQSYQTPNDRVEMTPVYRVLAEGGGYVNGHFDGQDEGREGT